MASVGITTPVFSGIIAPFGSVYSFVVVLWSVATGGFNLNGF